MKNRLWKTNRLGSRRLFSVNCLLFTQPVFISEGYCSTHCRVDGHGLLCTNVSIEVPIGIYAGPCAGPDYREARRPADGCACGAAS